MYVVFQRMYLIWFSTKHSLAEDPGSRTSGPVFPGPPWLITVLLRARQLIRCWAAHSGSWSLDRL